MYLIVKIILFAKKLIWLWKDSFLLKMKPKYYQDILGDKIGPPKGERLRGGGLKIPCILEK